MYRKVYVIDVLSTVFFTVVVIDGCSFSTLFMKSGFQDYQVVKSNKLSKVNGYITR